MTQPDHIEYCQQSCPECDAEVEYKLHKRAGLKRVAPQLKRCDSCGAVFP
jgi:uncharacterized Zn finger protein